MNKFYLVLEDNFLWEKGCVLTCDNDGYSPIKGNDLWDTTEYNKSEYVSTKIIENNPRYFQRVYEVSKLAGVAYMAKDKAREYLEKKFK